MDHFQDFVSLFDPWAGLQSTCQSVDSSHGHRHCSTDGQLITPHSQLATE